MLEYNNLFLDCFKNRFNFHSKFLISLLVIEIFENQFF